MIWIGCLVAIPQPLVSQGCLCVTVCVGHDQLNAKDASTEQAWLLYDVTIQTEVLVKWCISVTMNGVLRLQLEKSVMKERRSLYHPKTKGSPRKHHLQAKYH